MWDMCRMVEVGLERKEYVPKGRMKLVSMELMCASRKVLVDCSGVFCGVPLSSLLLALPYKYVVWQIKVIWQSRSLPIVHWMGLLISASLLCLSLSSLNHLDSFLQAAMSIPAQGHAQRI
jgi:hypothetical protein